MRADSAAARSAASWRRSHRRQPRGELVHPPGRRAGAHLGCMAGQRGLIAQRCRQPVRMRGHRRLQVRGPSPRQVGGEVRRERGKAPVAPVGERPPGRQRVEPDRAPGGPGGHLRGELQRLGKVAGGQVVGLVEHHEHGHRQLRHAGHQLALARRDGRIGGEHEHGRIHRAQGGLRLGGVPRIDRAGARRVHQLRPGGQHRRIGHDGDRRQVAAVTRVSSFCHQVAERGQREALRPPVPEDGADTLVPAVTDGRGQCRQRRDAHRQQRTAEERVDQRALAPLGFPRDQHPQPLPGQPAAQRVQGGAVIVPSQAGQLIQGRGKGAAIVCCAHMASYPHR
jgi:hypothetical protein